MTEFIRKSVRMVVDIVTKHLVILETGLNMKGHNMVRSERMGIGKLLVLDKERNESSDGELTFDLTYLMEESIKLP